MVTINLLNIYITLLIGKYLIQLYNICFLAAAVVLTKIAVHGKNIKGIYIFLQTFPGTQSVNIVY